MLPERNSVYEPARTEFHQLLSEFPEQCNELSPLSSLVHSLLLFILCILLLFSSLLHSRLFPLLILHLRRSSADGFVGESEIRALLSSLPCRREIQPASDSRRTKHNEPSDEIQHK